MAKAFVTGGTGFIGRRLVRALAERGDEVTCLVRGSALPQRVAELKQYGAEVVFGELHNLAEILPGLREVGVVYHLAGATRARSLREFLSVNSRSYDLFTGFARQQTPPTVVLVSSLAAAGPSQLGQVQTENA